MEDHYNNLIQNLEEKYDGEKYYDCCIIRNQKVWTGNDLSEDERICGENLFAKHSVEYNDLPSFFMVFSWWEANKCLSWDETIFNTHLFVSKLVTVEFLSKLQKTHDLTLKYVVTNQSLYV